MFVSPPPILNLTINEVHVWRAHLDLPVWRIRHLAKTLSSEEQLRADRFHFERHRRRFIASRGFLRAILGRYLDLEPSQLHFSYDPRGKPVLASAGSSGMPCFNLSHSNELALYAITRDHAIGIDVEYIRPQPDAEQIAKRFFSPREYAVISGLPPEKRQEAFFNGWTVKEAYLKATGEGLAGLEHLEVCLSPGEPAALLSIQGTPQETCRWSVHQLTPAPGYVAALVVEGHSWHLSCFCSSETSAFPPV